MDVAVTALEGSGNYHLQAEIIGTAERLAKQAILGREVPLQIEQRWYGHRLLFCRDVVADWFIFV